MRHISPTIKIDGELIAENMLPRCLLTPQSIRHTHNEMARRTSGLMWLLSNSAPQNKHILLMNYLNALSERQHYEMIVIMLHAVLLDAN